MLITLGIIGVVAAITMPSIVSNIQGMQYRSKVKKTYSALVQAVNLAKVNNGVDSVTREMVASTLSGAKYVSETDPNHPKNYASFSNLRCSNYSVYLLPDASTLIFCTMNYGGAYYLNYDFQGYIDVNGKKGPNKITQGTDPQQVIGTDTYVEGYNVYTGSATNSFTANAYNGKPKQFYDIYAFIVPMKNYDNSPMFGPIRYIMTH